MTQRIVILRRTSGKPGIPEGDFTRVSVMPVDTLGRAEQIARRLLFQPALPRTIRVEILLPDNLEDITLEAEQLPDGSVVWYIGPPPTREVN